MQTRFKVGDVVTVRDDLVFENIYFMEDGVTNDTFVEGMDELSGKVVHISEISWSGKYFLREDEYSCNWVDEMFLEYFMTIEDLDIHDADIESMLGGML